MYPGIHFFQGTPYELHLRASLWTMLQGVIPPFVLVVGLFIIWLELDEWRIEKELKEEEKKEKKGKKKEKEEEKEEE
jgi:flagellar biosynthesis component FlhA